MKTEIKGWWRSLNFCIMICVIIFGILLIYGGFKVFGILITLFILLLLFLIKKKRLTEGKRFNWKLIIQLSILGFIISGPLYFLLGVISHLTGNNLLAEILFFPFYPWVNNLGEGGLILLYLIPLYGLIAGAVLGYIIASLTTKYKNKRSLFRKGGFYLLIFILLWMSISLVQPIKGDSDSFASPFYKETICRLQGCEYEEFELCVESKEDEWMYYPYPRKAENKKEDLVTYPKVSIDKLPQETTYVCAPIGALENQIYEVTRSNFSDIMSACVFEHSLHGKIYYNAAEHPLYGSYSFGDNKIYYADSVCGEIGDIRYRS